MPDLPLLAAGVRAVRPAASALLAGRLTRVVPGALLGGVLAVHALRRSGAVWVMLVVVAAFATHVLSLHYLTVTKTYGLSSLAMVGAFLLATRTEAPRWPIAFVVGMLAALAVGTRLPTVPVALLLAFWQARAGGRSFLAFCAGAAVGALPCLGILLDDPRAFWFNNVGFHELRKEVDGWLPILTQKAIILGKWILLPQNLILWCAAFLGWRADDESRSGRALACAGALGVLYLYATPTYLEYTVQLIPFLLIAAVPALAGQTGRRPAIVLGLAIWCFGLAFALRPTAADSARGRKLALWSHASVHSVAAYLHAHSDPGDRILSWWEGYPWLAGREGYRGVGFWESNVAKKLPAVERRRFHVVGLEQRRAWVEEGDPRLVVFPAGKWRELLPSLRRHYALAATFGTVRVFAREGDPKRRVKAEPSHG
mgnify:FL=1